MNFETVSALNRAYEVFARYEDSFGFARRSGVSRSLRELTSEDWEKMDAEFDMGVQLYSDDSTLLRHFLPRFLERLSEGPPSHPFELWDLGYRLNQFGWLEWPREEVEALRAVFEAWTREISTDNQDQVPIDFLLEVEDDVDRYLNIWLEKRPHELAKWLWSIDWEKHKT